MGHPLVDGTHTQPVALYIDVAGVMTPVGTLTPLPISGGGAGGGDASEAEQEVQTTELQGVNAKLTVIDGRVDTLETLIAATNTKLDTTIAAVDTLETLIGDTNTKLDQVNAALATNTAAIEAGGIDLGPNDEDNSLPVIFATNDILSAGHYKIVAASQTAAVCGATGAIGDYISGILVIPATTSPGLVTLLDGATSIPVFVGGTTTLIPFFIPLGLKCLGAAWKITTGANVSCIGIGKFT